MRLSYFHQGKLNRNDTMSEKSKLVHNNNLINIHPSIQLSLRLLQIFGYFPLEEIGNSDHKKLKFTWFSLKMFYSIIMILLLLVWFLLVFYYTLFVNLSISETTNLAFYVSAVLSNILFLKLAKDWPHLMNEWYEVETTMGSIGISSNLRRRLQLLTVTFLFIATVEHFLIQCYLFIHITRPCNTLQDGLRKFYSSLYIYIFALTDYTWWKPFIVHVVILRTTFSWTYIDVVIILMSTALVFRLKQFNTKIEILQRAQTKSPKLWRKMRDEHHRLYKLSCLLDDKLSYIILVSYGTNLYFILMQFFNSMRPHKNNLRKTYYYFSLILLIMRMLSVTLYGSWVSKESKRILPLLFSVSSNSYNKEVEKFIDQAIKNKIVISVRNFFKMTKGLVLQLAGAVVTYELVLIQFNPQLLHKDEEQDDNYSNNSCN